MRRLIHVFALAAVVAAQDAAPDTSQVAWVGDWEQAFATARSVSQPVMVCINSKDGESASDRAASITYHDPEFVALSRKFVMIVVSTLNHGGTETCPRFGVVSCNQHGACWKELRARHGEQFLLAGSNGEMISPQHAWFRPDGTLLRRKEYELTREELMERMRAVLAEVAGGEAGEPGVEPSKDAPLNSRDEAELERVREDEGEARDAAIGNLLAGGKTAARVALTDMLMTSRDAALRGALVRGLGKAGIAEAREVMEGCLRDRDEFVRSCAAVGLEQLAHAGSVPALLKRVKSESDTMARKNMYRALGACGGGAADKDAAKVLLRAITADKQNLVRKHAALALRGYEGPGAKLVVKPLEQLALRTKDRVVRSAIVYTLTFIGNRETTLPVFETIVEKQNDELGKQYMYTAIAMLKGTGGDFGRALWWLFAEDRDDPAR